MGTGEGRSLHLEAAALPFDSAGKPSQPLLHPKQWDYRRVTKGV